MKKQKQPMNKWDYLLALHLIYPASIIILLFFIPHLYVKGDYLCFYFSVRNLFSDISQLYVISDIAPFRYLPMSPVLFSYLLLFNEITGYVFIMILNIIMYLFLRNIILKIAEEIYKISSDQINTLKKMIFVIFILPFNLDIYFNGQMISLTLVCLLLSYYYFMKQDNRLRNNIIGSLFISISILLKPFFIIILPFLIKIQIKKYKIKIDFLSLFRYFFVSIIIGVNLFIFILNKQLLDGFLGINSMYEFFTSSQSLTNLLFLTNMNPQLIFFVLLILFFSILLVIFLVNGYKIDLLYFYGISVIIIMIIWPQSWPLYNLFFFSLLILMSFRLTIDKDLTYHFNSFWIYVLLNQLNLLIVSILIVIEMLGFGIHLHIISLISILICFGYYVLLGLLKR
ncbi:MAG: hypothetical protein ACW99E_04155 [Promethearchaeota archaeon]